MNETVSFTKKSNKLHCQCHLYLLSWTYGVYEYYLALYDTVCFNYSINLKKWRKNYVPIQFPLNKNAVLKELLVKFTYFYQTCQYMNFFALIIIDGMGGVDYYNFTIRENQVPSDFADFWLRKRRITYMLQVYQRICSSFLIYYYKCILP